MRIACFVLITCSVLPRLGHAQTSPDAVLSARAEAISEARGRPIPRPTAGKSEPSGKDDSRAGIPFEIEQPFGLILIRAQVNGHPATLVVDTGSSRTIVSPELAEVRPFSLELARPAEKGSGFVGIAGWGKATVELGSLKWNDQRVLVMNSLRDLSKSVGKRVDGIIGEDILSNFGSLVIDFKHHRLVLR